GRQWQRSVEMREEVAAAARLPAQRRPQRRGIDGDKQQIVPSGEMPRRRLGELCGGREMDVAVAPVDIGAVETARRLGFGPCPRRGDLVDRLLHAPDATAGGGAMPGKS